MAISVAIVTPHTPIAQKTTGLENVLECVVAGDNIQICVGETATTFFSTHASETPSASLTMTLTVTDIVTDYVTPTPIWHAPNGSMPVSYSAAQTTPSHGHGHWMMAAMALGGALFTVLCGIAWWAWKSRRRKRRLARASTGTLRAAMRLELY